MIYTNLVVLGVETHVPIPDNLRNGIDTKVKVMKLPTLEKLRELQQLLNRIDTTFLWAAKNHISTMKNNKIKAIDSSELVKDTATTFQHNRLVYLKKQNFVVQDGDIICPTFKKTNGKFTKQTQLG